MLFALRFSLLAKYSCCRPRTLSYRQGTQPCELAVLAKGEERTVASLRPEFDDGRAASAFVLRWLAHAGDMRVALQELPQRLAQNAHAASVHHANAQRAGQKCAIDKLLYLAGGLVYRLADDIDLSRHAFLFTRERHVDAAGARCRHRISACTCNHFSKIVARDLHLHGADRNLERIVIEVTEHFCLASQRLQAHGVA